VAEIVDEGTFDPGRFRDELAAAEETLGRHRLTDLPRRDIARHDHAINAILRSTS
jgi:hypothetical protein